MMPTFDDAADIPLVQRRIHKTHMSLHYLFGFASIFSKHR
jgi:hypothetical protein